MADSKYCQYIVEILLKFSKKIQGDKKRVRAIKLEHFEFGHDSWIDVLLSTYLL